MGVGAAILGAPDVGRRSSSNHKVDVNQAVAGGWQRGYIVPREWCQEYLTS